MQARWALTLNPLRGLSEVAKFYGVNLLWTGCETKQRLSKNVEVTIRFRQFGTCCEWQKSESVPGCFDERREKPLSGTSRWYIHLGTSMGWCGGGDTMGYKIRVAGKRKSTRMFRRKRRGKPLVGNMGCVWCVVCGVWCVPGCFDERGVGSR